MKIPRGNKQIVLGLLFIVLIYSTAYGLYKLGVHNARGERLSNFLNDYKKEIKILNNPDFKIIADMATTKDFETLKHIMKWCHDYGVDKKRGCDEMAMEFSLMARRNGFIATAIPIGGHWVVKVFCRQYNKTILMDSYFNAYYANKDGVPVNLLELYARFHTHHDRGESDYYLKKILYDGNNKKWKYETFDEALGALKDYYAEHGVIMKENMNEKRRAESSELYAKNKGTIIDLTPHIFEIYFD